MGVRILIGDAREKLAELPDYSVHCCVTSPPYFGLRDYGVAGQIGLEDTPDAYVEEMVGVFREVRRVLRDDGTVFLNIGDSYAGSGKGGNPLDSPHQKQATNAGSLTVIGNTAREAAVTNITRRTFRPGSGRADGLVDERAQRNRNGLGAVGGGIKAKDLIGIPWLLAFALRDDGWWLRSAIVWAKPNGMPGSQEDRCTSSYEMIFHLSKSAIYWSDFDAIKTPPRESSMARTAQNLQAQAGSHRANGGAKTNGPMKAVGVRVDKQRGHSRRHAGFNDRWDAMEKSEQQARPAMMRDVWFVPPASYDEWHFAVMPDEIARRCILAGSPVGGVVLDPFLGSGTTAEVADRLGRDAIGIELNPQYVEMAKKRAREPGFAFPMPSEQSTFVPPDQIEMFDETA